MQEQLTIEHIIGYTPHNLKGVSGTFIWELDPFDRKKGSLGFDAFLHICKPLLHPLERLTDEYISGLSLTLVEEKELRYYRQVPSYLSLLPVKLYKLLLLKHFDIHGLIKKRLALPKPIER